MCSTAVRAVSSSVAAPGNADGSGGDPAGAAGAAYTRHPETGSDVGSRSMGTCVEQLVVNRGMVAPSRRGKTGLSSGTAGCRARCARCG